MSIQTIFPNGEFDRMKVRERQSYIFPLLIAALIMLLGKRMNCSLIISIGGIICILPIIFSKQFYLIFFINTNSPCALYAGRLALNKGYDPKGQNRKYWDPGKLKLTEVYDLYKEKRSAYPVFGTSGFVFTVYKLTHKCINVEFYEYTENKQFVKYYSFYFDYYKEAHDRIDEKAIRLEDITPAMVFVPLEKR